MERHSYFAEGRRNAVRQPACRRREATRLGEVLRELMDNQVSQRQADFASVAKLCSQVLPVGLSEHCETAGISGGQLKLQVDSPVYMYELQLASSGLLKELRQHCPRVPIEKIKLVLA